jgi:hypothetical protein
MPTLQQQFNELLPLVEKDMIRFRALLVAEKYSEEDQDVIAHDRDTYWESELGHVFYHVRMAQWRCHFVFWLTHKQVPRRMRLTKDVMQHILEVYKLDYFER